MIAPIIAMIEFIIIILLIYYIFSNISFRYYDAKIIFKRIISKKVKSTTTKRYLIDVASYGKEDSKKIFTLEVDADAYEQFFIGDKTLIKL